MIGGLDVISEWVLKFSREQATVPRLSQYSAETDQCVQASKVKTMEDHKSIWTSLFETPFELGYVDAGGLRTRYLHTGKAGNPSLIMLHGTAGSLENFVLNFAEHSKHFNCFAFDMIGAGLTDKPDHVYETTHYVSHLRDFMKATSIEKASFIGVSLGSRVASRLAIDHPEQVEKLTLISATGYFPLQPEQASIRSTRSAAVGNPTWDNVRTVMKGLYYDENSTWDDLVAVRLACYSKPAMKAAMPHILGLMDPEIYERNRIKDEEWKRISSPTLVVASVDSDDIFLKTSRKIATLIPNAELFEMKRCSHWPQFEDVETFNRKNIAFMLH